MVIGSSWWDVRGTEGGTRDKIPFLGTNVGWESGLYGWLNHGWDKVLHNLKGLGTRSGGSDGTAAWEVSRRDDQDFGLGSEQRLGI